jgi:hypothetical protein
MKFHIPPAFCISRHLVILVGTLRVHLWERLHLISNHLRQTPPGVETNGSNWIRLMTLAEDSGAREGLECQVRLECSEGNEKESEVSMF